MRLLIGLCLAVIFLGAIATSGHSHSPVAAAAVAPTEKPLPVNQTQLDKCDRLLNEMARKTGVLKSYQVDGKIGVVEVRAPYYFASFDGKATLNSVLRCVMTEGRQDDSVDMIDYIDFRTHKSVATWSASLGLRVE